MTEPTDTELDAMESRLLMEVATLFAEVRRVRQRQREMELHHHYNHDQCAVSV